MKTKKEIHPALAAIKKHRRDYWKTAFTLFKEHRDECPVCRDGCPLMGPLCETGFVLRNNSINEICKESDRERQEPRDVHL